MLGGYVGTILRVDLSNKIIVKEPLDLGLARMFLGSKGFGAKILYDELKPGINPFSPDNILIFATGPLVGTMACGGCKFAVITRSPLTGAFLDSHSSGFWGPELKFAGYDVVIVKGRAEKPVYLWIMDDIIEIRSAEHLWGKTTHETENAIRKELDDLEVRVASIGPAGEKLVRFACVTNDLWRQAGRGGSGAVMGSKNLKAVAVRGTRGVEVADLEAFKRIVEEVYEIVKVNPTLVHDRKGGTCSGLLKASTSGLLPWQNFRSGIYDGRLPWDGDYLQDTYGVNNFSCFSCTHPDWCVKTVQEGPYAGTMMVGPEYESVGMIGSNCGIEYIPAMIKANLLCDQLGLDTISTGAVVAFAMECFEKGKIRKKDTGGIDLRFGNHEALIQIIELIAKREGIGDLLAEGTKRAAAKIGKGTEKFAMHTKGLEFPSCEIRGVAAQALAFATADRGACHLRAYTCEDEVRGVYGDRRDLPAYLENKGKLIKSLQDGIAVHDCTGLCRFISSICNLMATGHLRRLLNAGIGTKLNERDLLEIGERVYNLTRLFNVREGFARRDDTLPWRVTHEPVPEGPAKGICIKPEYLDKMLDDYYAARGWDKEGIPTEEKLKELGLR